MDSSVHFVVPIFMSGEVDLVNLSGRLLESGRKFSMNINSSIHYLDIDWTSGTFDDIPFSIKVMAFQNGVFQLWISLNSCNSCDGGLILRKGKVRVDGKLLEKRLYDFVVDFLSWMIVGEGVDMGRLMNFPLSREVLSGRGLDLFPVGISDSMIITGTAEYVILEGEEVSIRRSETRWRLELPRDEDLFRELPVYIYGHILVRGFAMFFNRWSDRVRMYMRNIRDNGVDVIMYRFDELVKEKMNLEMALNLFYRANGSLRNFYLTSSYRDTMEPFPSIGGEMANSIGELIPHITGFYGAIKPTYGELNRMEMRTQDTITFLGVLGGVGAIVAAFLTGDLDLWSRAFMAALLISIPLGFVWMERRIRKRRLRKAYMSYVKSRLSELNLEEKRILGIIKNLQNIQDMDPEFGEMLMGMYESLLEKIQREKYRMEAESGD